MASTKLYMAIYVVLFVPVTVQVLVEFTGLSYWLAFGVTIVLSAVRAVLAAAYFQYLRLEPWLLTYLVCIDPVAALAPTLAASHSLL